MNTLDRSLTRKSFKQKSFSRFKSLTRGIGVNDRFYFAYGSNMDYVQMLSRCPSAIPVSSLVLHGWDFFINQRGVASIEPNQDSMVYGVVYKLSGRDLCKLDYFEGAPYVYRRERFFIDGLSSPIMVYIDPNPVRGAPKPGYLERIVVATISLNFPDEYVSRISNERFN